MGTDWSDMNERFRNYNPPISRELRQKHEQALANEFRWLNGMQASEKPESDLEHIDDMFEKNHTVSTKYPNLHSQVSSDDLPHMIYIHDTGELIAHDLSHSVPDYELLKPKIKRQEAAAFRYLTREYISDIELRAYARLLHKRFELANPNDKTALWAKILDWAQATDFGSKYVFPARKLRTRAERQQEVNHIYGLQTAHSTNLIRLIDGNAQDELIEFLDEHFMMLRENGYRQDEVDPYRKQSRDVLNSYRVIASR